MQGKSGTKNMKPTNQDLPEGAQPAYHNQVIPSIFHWAVGNVSDPFNIDEDKLIRALKTIWAHVFSRSVPFKSHAVIGVVSKALTLIDLLTMTFRPINDFLSGATVSHQQQPRLLYLSLQVMLCKKESQSKVDEKSIKVK